jgi:PelA/Pel-15E family pectate lyase
MKAALVAHGFPLYSEIWSDQPPVLTFLLAALEIASPVNVAAARALILAFSGLLLWSLFRIVLRTEGRSSAWIAVAALMATSAFQWQSVAVMIGLPAVALAVAALDQTLVGATENKNRRFLLAGTLFGLSLQTKLFTGIMFPSLILATFATTHDVRRPWRAQPVKLLLLLLSITISFGVIAALVGEPILSQLIEPHVSVKARFVETGGVRVLLTTLWSQGSVALGSNGSIALFLIFAAGLFVGLRELTVGRAIPLLWLAIGTVILAFHRPLWGHQVLILYVAIAWISGLSIRIFSNNHVRRMATGTVLAWLLFATIPWRGLMSISSPTTPAAETYMLQTSSPESWVVADTLQDAYLSQRLVPPELAVWSDKRRAGGYLPTKALIDIVKRRQPEQVLLRRFRQPKPFLDFLDSTYQRVEADGDVRHYLRKTTAIRLGASRPGAEDLLKVWRDFKTHSVQGGFSGHYDLRTGQRWGRSPSGEPMTDHEILMRPAGSTQEIGQCLLRAYRQTGWKSFWEGAIDAGRAIACAQGAEGGWNAIANINPRCEQFLGIGRWRGDSVASLDDAASQSAVLFLIDLATMQATKPTPAPAWLDQAIKRGLEFLLIAQNEAGGWPQKYPNNGKTYASYSTLNDGVTSAAIATLLRGYEQFGDSRYLAAAVRGGDFIIKAQGPPSQPAWAQQYDSALHPASARKFEPAAFGSEETGFAMNALLDLYEVTGEERFLNPLASARAWLESSIIRPNIWARLYEIGTNRPIYGDRDGSVHYHLDELSRERARGYRWEGEFPSITMAMRRYDALVAGGRSNRNSFAQLGRGSQPPELEKSSTSPATPGAVSSASSWADRGVLSSATFVQNCKTLLDSFEPKAKGPPR